MTTIITENGGSNLRYVANQHTFSTWGAGGQPESSVASLSNLANFTQTMTMTSGNVGIGTTAPSAKLHVEGIVQATSFTGSGASLTGMSLSSFTTGQLGVANGGTGAATLTANKVLVGMGTTAVLQPTNLHWDNANNRLGINATSPGQALHVVGDTRIEGNLTVNGTQTIVNTVAGTTEQLIITNDGTGPALKVTQTGSSPIADFYDDGEVLALRVADGGNVGIGTSLPQAKLHVMGSANITGNAALSSSPAGWKTYILNEYNNSAFDRWWLFASFAKANFNGIDLRGNFSRIDYPYYIDITINTNSYGDLPSILSKTTTIGNSYIIKIVVFENTSTNVIDVWIFSSSYGMANLTFNANATINMTPSWTSTAPTASASYILRHDTSLNALQSIVNGYVGIGTVSPNAKFHIYDGDIYASGQASSLSSSTTIASTIAYQNMMCTSRFLEGVKANATVNTSTAVAPPPGVHDAVISLTLVNTAAAEGLVEYPSFITVVSTETYTFSAWVRNTQTRNVQIWVLGAPSVWYSTSVSSTWVQIKVTFTAISTNLNVQPRIDLEGGAGTLYITGCKFEKSGNPTPFIPCAHPTDAYDRVVTESVIANTITVSNNGLNPTLHASKDGNVGIGTTNPQAKLDVVGAIKTTSQILNTSGRVMLNQSGCVLQNIFAQLGSVNLTTSGNVFSASITPSSTSSKVLIQVSLNALRLGGTANNYVFLHIRRGTTNLQQFGDDIGYALGNLIVLNCAGIYLDTPSTTSAVTYNIYATHVTAEGVSFVYRNGSMILQEIAG